MKHYSFLLFKKPISVNEAWWESGYRTGKTCPRCKKKMGRIISKRVKEKKTDAWLDYIVKTVRETLERWPIDNCHLQVSLQIHHHANYVCKNGEPRTRDVSNILKFIEDGMAMALQFNDSFTWRILLRKVHDPDREFTIVRVGYEKGKIIENEKY